jgi:hypothetical protein
VRKSEVGVKGVMGGNIQACDHAPVKVARTGEYGGVKGKEGRAFGALRGEESEMVQAAMSLARRVRL